ncbi:DUF4179 domain-containing protein [Bacillus sp. BGMRC 2118]|nr:DUF4179 domain-containing protein [Bacillus sp. BGMRC 2118]
MKVENKFPFKANDFKSILNWFDTKKQLFYQTAYIYSQNSKEIEDIFYNVLIKVYEVSQRFNKDIHLDINFILLNECWERSSIHLNDREHITHGKILTKLMELDLNDRNFIVLKNILKLTNEEVSQLLKVPVETVNTSLYDAATRLLSEREVEVEQSSCKQYKNTFIDYINMSLHRDKKIELEKHIYTCTTCNNLLYSLQEIFIDLENELQILEPHPDLMNRVTDRIQVTERENLEEKKRLEKKRTIISIVSVSVVMMTLLVGFLTNSFSNFYYSWLEWRELEDEVMLTYLKNGTGKELNLESEYNGIKITIKTAIADDYQTLIYYDIETSSEENKKYAISKFDGLMVENEFEVLNHNANYVSHTPTEALPIDKGDNVFSGTISLSPLAKDSGTINLKLTKLLEVIEETGKESTMLATFRDSRTIDGEWSFDIPVTKQDSVEYEIGKEVAIDGLPITIEKVTFAPTTTLLHYQVNSMQTKKQIQDIYINSIERGKQVSRNQNYYGSHYENNSYIKIFSPLYFEESKKVKITFSSIHYYIEDFESFALDLDRKFPQTFQYNGNPITVEKVTIGKPTKIVVTDTPPQNRGYESLQFGFTSDQENYQIMMGYIGHGAVLIDREGKVYDPAEYNYFDATNEPPRYYETNYEIELNKEFSDEEIIPKRLEILGYNTTKYLDEVVSIELKKEVDRSKNK